MRNWVWVLLSSFGLVALGRADSVPNFSRILLPDPPSGGQPNVVTERGHGFLMALAERAEGRDIAELDDSQRRGASNGPGCDL